MRYFSEEALITMLKEFWEENGRCPTSNDIGGDSGIPSARAYKSMFGSFYEALVIAGLKPRKREDSNEPYLIERLRELKKRVGRVPLQADLRKYPDMPSCHTYADFFGTWKEALERAFSDDNEPGVSL